MSKYEDLVSRNWGLIVPETQERIGEVRVLLAGCGVGTQIGVLAARTGFRNFLLADGDDVEVSNLNRQEFFRGDLGRNKAEVTAERILAVNPTAKAKVISHFLKKKEEITSLVKKSDVVVNMADPDEAMYTISEIAQAEGKLELHPLNLGWMGYCIVLTPATPSLEEIVGERIYGLGFYLQLIKATLGELPEETRRFFEEHGEEIFSGKRPAPQLGVTTFLTAAIVVRAMVRILAGESVPLAPTPIIMG